MVTGKFSLCRIKENMKNAGGARLNSNYECFTIGFHSHDGKRSLDHFNFRADESRNNVVVVPGVTHKLKHNGDNKTINIYQKPRRLLDWMVNHFSQVGDWVVDLCSGSGTGLASSLALGRHCVAIEIDKRQSSVLRGRVLNLVDDLVGEGETKGVMDDEEILEEDTDVEAPKQEASGKVTEVGASVEDIQKDST